MRINNNISAVITNKQLLRTEGGLSDVMERLSSGLKINHSKDDPSGMAISGRMKVQVAGLNKATQNANDGMSVIETADGALNEVSSILQRMRELAVQAANDTNSQTERDAIQLEVDSLRSEVDRIANTTEFNTKTLLDGSLDRKVYSDQVSRIGASSSVDAGTYIVTVSQAATRAESNVGTDLSSAGDVTKDQAGILYINGATVEVKEGMTGAQVYSAIRDAAELGNATVSELGKGLQFKSQGYGNESELKIQSNNPALSAYLGLASDDETYNGKEAVLSLGGDFPKDATIKQEGLHFSISGANGFEMDFKANTDKDGNMYVNKNSNTGASSSTSYNSTGDITLVATEIGGMTLQIGANGNQDMNVTIPDMSSDSMYLDTIDMRKVGGASRAISRLDEDISYVSKSRAKLGAYENRLEHTTDNLSAAEQNMTSALSRIEDADMAKEITDYTKYNVLQQAATSVLSQANQIPQMALQLLQK